MTENEKNILLFLTQINRRMKNSGNNKTTIKWVKECKECGINNTHKIVAIKRALLFMHIIKENTDGSYSWNREKTEPNVLLPKGLEMTIKSQSFLTPKKGYKKSQNRDKNITLLPSSDKELKHKNSNKSFIFSCTIDIEFKYI